MKKLYISTFLSFLIVIALAYADCPEGTMPQLGHTFKGLATYSGSALASKTVTVTVGSNEVTTTTDSDGNYQVVAVKCGSAGSNTVSFTVCTRGASETFNYSAGAKTPLNLTISSACPAAAAPSGGGGGGAGGGGGVVAEEEAEATETQVWGSVEAGQENTMVIDNELIPVSEFGFVTDEDLTNVEVTVNSYTEKPSSFEAVPLSESSSIYKYIEIIPENIEEDDLTKSEIEFDVPLSWLDENNAAPEDVIFLGFEDGKWTELATGFVSKDSVNAYYKAENPGFGSFSIGLKPKAAEKELIEEEVPEEAEELEEIVPEVKKKKKPIGWAIVAGIIAIGLVTYFLVTKKKKKKEEEK